MNPNWRNRVYPLTITILTPLHINSGARLAEQVDFYIDGNTTYVLNSDVALDLALERWEALQPAYDEVLHTWESTLTEAAERLQRRRERNIREIQQFEENPPRDRDKAKREEVRLVKEATEIKERAANLEARRANPPAPPTAGLPTELLQNSGFNDLIKTTWITVDDLRNNTTHNGRPLVRYAYEGRPESRSGSTEIYDLIKDVADRPYLPGSSLKGALRSALAWSYAADLPAEAFERLSNKGAKTADNTIEEALFYGRTGSDSRKVGNHILRDVLRAVHIGDSTPSTVGPNLATVQIYPKGSPLTVEVVPSGVELQATLQVEGYLFNAPDAHKVLRFDDWPQRLEPERLAAGCRERAAALIAAERMFFATQAPELTRIYADLEQRLNSLDSRSFLLPVGWGTGWLSKTLADRLRATPERETEFVQVVRTYKLKKEKSSNFRPDDLFPATRKLIYSGGRPRQPLGWLQIRIGEEKQR